MKEKILVIDDDLDSLKLIGLLLQRQGYQVAAAPGGSQGLAQAENEPPDLILLDIMMPGMDGYQVCRKLRRNPQLAHIPVIMFTAKTQVEDKVAGFDAGADDYLTKPTHPAELAARVKALLTRSSAVQDAAIQPVRGKIVATLGVRGGSGVTTLAINLSLALAETQPHLVLVDLQLGMGAVGLQLGYPQGAGLSQLLEQHLNQLQIEHVEQALVDYNPALRLLLTRYDPTTGTTPLLADHAKRILSLLTRVGNLIVVDLGSRVTNTALEVLKLADLILLCLPPQQPALLMARTLLRHLEQGEVLHGQIGLVLTNIVSSAPSVSPLQAESQLGHPVLGNVSHAAELALAALEQERPILALEPASTPAIQFRELAQQVVDNLEKGKPASE